MRENGLVEGLISWNPWQLAQLATRRSPAAPARPWKLPRNSSTTDTRSPCISAIFTDP